MVGRTGAGKTSLVAAILRLAHTDADGSVLIDDMDVRCVPLGALRRAVTVIPQEPVLFSGTVRDNLDPSAEFQDKQLWDALRSVSTIIVWETREKTWI